VAKPELRADPLFGAAILVVTRSGAKQHAGFIVNRPTSVTLGSVFPEDGPSQKVVDRSTSAARWTPTSYLPWCSGAKARARARSSSCRRFRRAQRQSRGPRHRLRSGARALPRGHGGLEAGRAARGDHNGLWYVLEPDPALVLPKSTDGLWEELARRSKLAADAI